MPKKFDREPIAWITRGGKHVPIFEKDELVEAKENMTDEETKKYVEGLYNKLDHSEQILPQNRIAKEMLLADLHATREAIKLADVEGIDKTVLTNLSIYVDDKTLKNGGTASDYLRDRIGSLKEVVEKTKTELGLEKRKGRKDYLKDKIRRDLLFIDDTEEMIKKLKR